MVRRILALWLLCGPALAWGVEAARPVNPDTSVGSTALGALNAACSVKLSGQAGVGFQLIAGTLVGTILPEVSYDNGTTWVASFFDDPVTGNKVASIVFGSSNTATSRTIVGAGGISDARIRVSAFTSGTANCFIRASNVSDPSIVSAGALGAPAPPTILQVGGKDGSNNLQPFNVTPKGTQGANGITTQDLHDAGRSQILLVWERVSGTANVESTLTNFTIGTKAGAAVTAATSYTVTAGKTLRIQSINVTLTSTSTVANNGRMRIRQAASSIANSSPIIWDQDIPWPIGGTVAANEGTSVNDSLPEGLEVAGGQQVTVTWITAAATCTVTVAIVGYEY